MNQQETFIEFKNHSNDNFYVNNIMNDPDNGKWNNSRQNFIKSYNNDKALFFREISNLNIHSINEIIPKDSGNNHNYSKNIIKTYLNHLINNDKNKTFFSKDSINFLINKREKFDLILKIISKYFDFFMEKHFNILLNEQNKINFYQNKIQYGLNITIHSKEILNMIKNKYLKINVQIFLKRQRLNNNIEIYKVLKKIEKMKNDYITLEKIVNADIKKSNHNAFSKIKSLLNDISYYKYNNKTLFCFWFSQNLQNLKKKYLNKFQDYY